MGMHCGRRLKKNDPVSAPGIEAEIPPFFNISSIHGIEGDRGYYLFFILTLTTSKLKNKLNNEF